MLLPEEILPQRMRASFENFGYRSLPCSAATARRMDCTTIAMQRFEADEEEITVRHGEKWLRLERDVRNRDLDERKWKQRKNGDLGGR